MSARLAFFAPPIVIAPLRGFPPLITNLSTACSFVYISVGLYEIIGGNITHYANKGKNLLNFEATMNQQTILDALTVIHNRKSVRNFTGESVTQDQLEILLKAAMAAPTAVNCQPWEFIVVTDRKTLDNLADALPYAKMLFKAGAAIIVCGNPSKAHKQMAEYAVIDSTLASENILLAAEALGLGAIWTAAYPYPDRMKPVKSILNIPSEIIPLNVIPIGYPTGEDVPKKKYNPEKIHRERW
jgi:nitroreductase